MGRVSCCLGGVTLIVTSAEVAISHPLDLFKPKLAMKVNIVTSKAPGRTPPAYILSRPPPAFCPVSLVGSTRFYSRSRSRFYFHFRPHLFVSTPWSSSWYIDTSSSGPGSSPAPVCSHASWQSSPPSRPPQVPCFASVASASPSPYLGRTCPICEDVLQILVARLPRSGPCHLPFLKLGEVRLYSERGGDVLHTDGSGCLSD